MAFLFCLNFLAMKEHKWTYAVLFTPLKDKRLGFVVIVWFLEMGFLCVIVLAVLKNQSVDQAGL